MRIIAQFESKYTIERGKKMRSYVRESHNMGNGRRYITRYTPEEYFLYSIIKFLLFLFLLWPLQLMFWGVIFILKWTFKAILWLIILPFRLIFHKKD